MRFPWQRKALTADPAVPLALQGGWSPYPLLGGGSRQRIQDAFNVAKGASYAWLYRNSPSLRMVIDCIVRNAGSLELRLYEEVSPQERKPRPEHPAALSVRYPSETVSADKFVRQMMKDFCIYDDAVAVMIGAPNRQVQFNWVPFQQIEVQGDGAFTADNYRYWRPDGTYVDFPADIVFHWHGENPQDPRIGLSHLDTLRDVIAEEVALRQAVTELSNSGLTAPVWAYRPLEAPPLAPKIASALEEDLTNKVRGRNRKVLLTQEGTELRSFGVSPEDAQMIEMRHAILVSCAAEFGMPLGMLAENPTEEARNVFINDCLGPLTENYTRFLNQRLLVQIYNWTDGCFEFDLDEKRMGNEWIKTLISAAGAPIFTRDESRARLGQAPLPDGVGAVPVVPSNVQKDDGTSTGKPSVDVMPIQDPNGPPQDGSHRAMLDLAEAMRKQTEAAADSARWQAEVMTEAVKALMAKASQQDPTSGTHEDFRAIPQYVAAHRGDLQRAHTNIDVAKALLDRHYSRLTRSLASTSPNWSRWDRELAKDLEAFIGGVVEEEGKLYATRLVGEFDVDRTRNYVRAMAEGAAQAINAKAREEVEKLGKDTAINRFNVHSASASASIGGGATRWAREEAARQAPHPENRVKVWVADSQRHAHFSGQRVSLDDDWPAGFAPGASPGCRCTLSIE